MEAYALLLAAGLAAGFANALAGGGALLVFPAMLLVGLPPTVANASTAPSPSGRGTPPPYRPPARLASPRPAPRPHLALGGAAGAALLLATGERLLRGLVPWPLLAATPLFATAPWPRRRAELRAQSGGGAGFVGPPAELGCAVYGGCFGAGLGVMPMALYEATGTSGGDPRLATAFKNLAASATTAAAIAGSPLAGVVAWGSPSVALGGAFLGGWLGGRAVQHANAATVRWAVLAAASLLTAREFWVAWPG